MGIRKELNHRLFVLGERLRHDVRFVIGLLFVSISASLPMFSIQQLAAFIAGASLLVYAQNGKRTTLRGRIAVGITIVILLAGAIDMAYMGAPVHSYMTLSLLSLILVFEAMTRGWVWE
jgi:4-hydroxybenzoate polyprenyltransferase